MQKRQTDERDRQVQRDMKSFDEPTHLSMSTCRVICLNLRSEVKELVTMVTVILWFH